VTSASTGTPITGEYNVQRNGHVVDVIASGVRPSSSRREINRTMIALFRANPAAFNGNINCLRSGSVLRIPELSDIEAISTGEATAEVARQAAEWSGAQPSQVAQEEANRLRLVTPAETPAAPTPGTPAPEQVAKAPTTTPSTTGPTPQDNRVALPNQGWPRLSRVPPPAGRSRSAAGGDYSGTDRATDRANGRDAADH
jgi:FimV-like protein